MEGKKKKRVTRNHSVNVKIKKIHGDQDVIWHEELRQKKIKQEAISKRPKSWGAQIFHAEA